MSKKLTKFFLKRSKDCHSFFLATSVFILCKKALVLKEVNCLAKASM